MRRLLLVACSLACSRGDDSTAIAGATTAPAPAVAVARSSSGTPHGGTIALVAVTDEGDAAATVDDLGGVRLWPSLDGRRPPVAIAATATTQLALGHAGDGLLVAVVDQAGGVRLVELARDGAIRGRGQLPDEVAAEQVVMVGDGVLVRRRDESLELYDASGTSRGRIVAEPGERIATVAARRGGAIALLAADQAGQATASRRLIVDGQLAWGTRVKLSEPVLSATIALSPDHRRLAALGTTGAVVVFDLDAAGKRHDGSPITAAVDGTTLGFVDDDHVAVIGPAIQWWTAAAQSVDPWAPPVPPPPPPAGVMAAHAGGAVGDGLAVAGYVGALSLEAPNRTRYLGWKQLGAVGVMDAGDRLVVTTTGTDLLWLDDRLTSTRTTELHELVGAETAGAIAVGDHHAVIRRVFEAKWIVELVDVEHPKQLVPLGSYAAVTQLVYEPASHVLAIVGDATIARYQLDLARSTAIALPPLTTAQPVAMLRLLDPARAHGAVAIAVAAGAQSVVAFEAPKPDATVTATQLPITGVVVAIDAAGTVYRRVGEEIVADHRGGTATRFGYEGPTELVVASHDTTHLAVVGQQQLAMVDANGVVRWRQPTWGAVSVSYSADDRRVVVQAVGGIVMFDVATGERVAVSCGWGFGLHDEPVAPTRFGQAPVCEA